MKHTDKLGIIATATELISKHMDLSTIKQQKDTEIEAALRKAYKTAEAALLTYTRQQVAKIDTITALTDCFINATYGFGALGMRQDLMRKKLLGAPKSGTEALREAIEKDTQEDQPMGCLDELDGMGFDHQNPETFASQAFASYSYYLMQSTDRKALALVYLIHRCLECGWELDVSMAAIDIQYNSCLKVINGAGWENRPLAGYFAANDASVYQYHDANREFLSIFGGKLGSLLSQASTYNEEYFKAIQIKQHLQEQILSIYTRSIGISPMDVYDDIGSLIAASKTTQGITQSVVDDVCHGFAYTQQYSSHGERFELNRESLQSLAHMMESLGLQELQDARAIMSRIKAVCA